MGRPAAEHMATWSAVAVLAACGLAACGRGSTPTPPRSDFDLRLALSGGDDRGFLRVEQVPTLLFPRDHGPHPGYRTEWWYWTGNVAAADGRAFGFELVFFRHALRPPGATAPEASLDGRELVIAHAALTDVAAGRFHARERIRRRDDLRAGLRGGDVPLELFCGDWSATARPDGDGWLPLTLRARDPAFAFELDVFPGKTLVLQGDRGRSQKGRESGNASVYWSATRLPCRGTIDVDGQRVEVAGLAWCDREWSTSALDPDQVGWDWFSLQFDDGSELMWYQLRRGDGSVDPHSQGLVVAGDGTTERLAVGDVVCTARGEWRAGDGRAAYPASWRLQVPRRQIDVEVVPRVADQELRAVVRYWEGSVAVTGRRGGAPLAGLGYLEMTGYAR